MFLHLIPPIWNDELSSSSAQHHTMLAYCLKWLQSLQSNDSIQEVVQQTVHCVFQDTALKYLSGEIYDFQPALKCYVDLDWNSIQAFIWDTLRRRDETDNHKVCSSLYSLWRKAKEISHFPPQEPGYALHDAAKDGYFHIVKVLVENEADVNADGGFYGFALQAAAYQGELDIVKYLVEKGADVNAEGGFYGFAMQAAAFRGDLDIVNSSIWGHLDIVKYLVEKGADVNAKGGEYGFALQAAADRVDIVHYLVEKGADVNAKGGRYGFALQAAAHWGKLDVIKYFVEEKGVDVNTKGGRYGSALEAAQWGNELEVVKYLQEHGATE
ncbi:hypothetical protein D9758_010630 [Tetrapyrgos nigripes]|uniref:Uncharacterized protein n=1 Tax=Tetrapyrgos nigripes TaxID=182062 RepID=A0A8H5D5Z7_9AGAR|nr:hypothetical protein D9758_010630 [Tetrapyrgos nigripes]